MRSDASTPLLSVRDLSVGFAVGDGEVVRAVDRVSFELLPGGTLGLVGESGCGKSATLRALVGLQAPGKVLGGQAILDSRDLLQLDDDALEDVRGTRIGMIFQDPASTLNPVLTVGDQLTEVLRVKRHLTRRHAAAEAIELLERVGVPAARRRVSDYPHQLSGGMRQRVMISLALAGNPSILLADEPTTALDVTVQDQILTLLESLKSDYDMAIVLVSHDLGVIAQACDHVAVMYAGRVVECGGVDEVLDTPRHPYTAALLSSAASGQPVAERGELAAIGGQPPDLTALPDGCSFAPRCKFADAACGAASMRLDHDFPSHGSACLFPERMER